MSGVKAYGLSDHLNMADLPKWTIKSKSSRKLNHKLEIHAAIYQHDKFREDFPGCSVNELYTQNIGEITYRKSIPLLSTDSKDFPLSIF